MNLRVGLVQINVTDLEEARRFYGGTLGIPLEEPFGPDAPFALRVEGQPAVLVYRVERRVEQDYPDQTGATLVFFTEDLDGTIARWREVGVAFIPIAWSEDGSGTAPCPFGRFIAFRDPFGNVHELLQPG